ncbi:hypothetical protein H310_15234 [Aphanomyces invadans]|uniref:Uncharacterized protein n=1 Tax=Aphanomyces invadans TaxID=157072 RepID=A0A024T7M0_9STRA|nr:hypothetical protein H310_15234 [Aphanomyces invadans]ETV89925.1 hypothetical protein H310_15234 [Aphanomyces invadans]|eukprot:XP_008881443.1 hypothetical protein H310_15234 [Aphanomyces invadans]
MRRSLNLMVLMADNATGITWIMSSKSFPAVNSVGVRHGLGDILVEGLSELKILEVKQRSYEYTVRLSDYMLPFAHQHCGFDFTFQQDNREVLQQSIPGSTPLK